MSNDLDKTDANLGYRLLKQDIAGLKTTITDRFDRVDKRLDEHREHDRELSKLIGANTERISKLEVAEAKQEGSNYGARLAALSGKVSVNHDKIEKLNEFRWKLIGVATGVAALAGGMGALIAKAVMGAVNAGS